MGTSPGHTAMRTSRGRRRGVADDVRDGAGTSPGRRRAAMGTSRRRLRIPVRNPAPPG